MATTFIVNEAIKNSGVFPRESVATLCWLAGWSEKSGTWAIYVKDVFEKNFDSVRFCIGKFPMSGFSNSQYIDQ